MSIEETPRRKALEPHPYWRTAANAVLSECGHLLDPSDQAFIKGLLARADTDISDEEFQRSLWIAERAVREWSRHHGVTEEHAAVAIMSTSNVPGWHIAQLPKDGWNALGESYEKLCRMCGRESEGPHFRMDHADWPSALAVCLPCAGHMLSPDGDAILLLAAHWTPPRRHAAQPAVEYLIDGTLWRLHLTKSTDGWWAVLTRKYADGTSSLGSRGPLKTANDAKTIGLEWIASLAGLVVADLPKPEPADQ